MEERPESPHLCTQDTDTNHPTLFPPSSPDFHGFGPETSFPQRLVLDTKGEGDEEQVVKVYRMKQERKSLPVGDRGLRSLFVFK